MFNALYINPIYWVLAVAGLLAWARFAAWMAQDVERLDGQKPLLWKGLALGTLLLMFVFFIIMPWFWLAFPVNVVLAAGVIALYWKVRVGELGARGHLFRGTIQSVSRASEKLSERRAQRAVMLSYIQSDGAPMPLPHADDPMHAGMTYLDQLVVQALQRRAENAELSPGTTGYDLKLFVDGVPQSQAPMPRNLAEPLIQSAKLLAGLAPEERRRPQEGVFRVRDANGIVTVWTVRTSGTTAGERLGLAADEKGRWEYTVDRLGLNAEQLAAVRSLTDPLQGAVIVATPRGTGRTTTLYALLRMHDAFTNAVQTLESNPQAELEGVTVTRFDPRSGETSYARVLQSVFLKDPTIVMSAQCPDSPTAELIARFSAEHHRVYFGLPAFDTMAALEIWLQLVPDKELAVRSLRAIIAQRLVRVLCPTCKTPYQPDEATLRRLNLPMGRNLQSFKANTEGLVDAKGHRALCPDCNSTGYRGRTGIFEILVVTDAMRKDILAGATLKQVQAAARKNNMTLLVEHGIRKFASGQTSIQEVLRVVTPEKGANPSSASGVHKPQR